MMQWWAIRSNWHLSNEGEIFGHFSMLGPFPDFYNQCNGSWIQVARPNAPSTLKFEQKLASSFRALKLDTSFRRSNLAWEICIESFERCTNR